MESFYTATCPLCGAERAVFPEDDAGKLACYKCGFSRSSATDPAFIPGPTQVPTELTGAPDPEGPPESDHFCWYCGVSNSDSASAAIVDMYSDLKTLAGRTTWNVQHVSVRRFEGCRRLHEMSRQVLLVGSIGCFVIATLGAQLFMHAGVLAIGFGTVSAFGHGALSSWFMRRHLRQKKTHPASYGAQHRNVKSKRTMAGWTIGYPGSGLGQMFRTIAGPIR